MWSEAVCAEIANLCAPRAMLCTYTASSTVQKALKNSGFEINLLKGYGKKRQMIRAIFVGERESEREIWFSRFCAGTNTAPKSALVVGGGVAGCVSAFKLRELGLDVTIAEKRTNIATNSSGNHCGILMPLITKPAVNLGRMHMNAFLHAVRFYGQNLTPEQIEFTGVINYAHEQKLVERLLKWEEFDADNGVFEINLTSSPHPSAFIKNDAKARPRNMCEAVSSGIKTLLNHEFTGFESLADGRVRADFAGKESIVTDVLVLALGSESMEPFAHYDVPLSSVRGQVTHIKPASRPPCP